MVKSEMELHQTPFIALTMSALIVHVVSGIVAVSTGRSWMRELSRLAQTVRLLSVRRREVLSPLSLKMVVVSRTALTIAVFSLGLDLVINA